MASPLKQIPRKPQGGGQKPKQAGPSMWMQLSAAFGVFLLLSLGYSFIRQYISGQDEVVPLSQIAQDITAGDITALDVSGDAIMATYTDGKTKKSRKESESSLTQTLSDYGLTPEKMAAVKIEIKDEGGLRFWALTLLPILVPVMFLFGVIWYLSRQMRGSGMQAFTFGRSMARLVNPEDEVQKV